MDFQKVDLQYLRQRAILKWGRWPQGVISLSVADIDYPPPREIQEAVAEWLSQDRTPYGHYQGDLELRELLAQKVAQENAIPASPEDILVVPGTMFAIFLATYLFLKPGDRALLSPSPVYGPFWKNVQAAQALPVGHDLEMKAGFLFRRDALSELVDSRTRLIMVCNPHNPTGKVLDRADLEAIASTALEHDLIIFSDELYEDMVLEGQHISIAGLSPEISRRTITVFGFSKALGIPGYRVAYMVVPASLRPMVLEATRRIIVHTDSLAQAAAMGSMRARGWWVPALSDHLRQMRDMALERLGKIHGLRCQRPQATPFLFPDIKDLGMSSHEAAEFLLEKAAVVVQPGTQFGPAGEGFIRINIGTSWEVLNEALERIDMAVSELRT
ncbi:MAG: pyridoxal phosphate-dependent aminotransferase [bacterium]